MTHTSKRTRESGLSRVVISFLGTLQYTETVSGEHGNVSWWNFWMWFLPSKHDLNSHRQFQIQWVFPSLHNTRDLSLRLSVRRRWEGEFVLINTDWIKDGFHWFSFRWVLKFLWLSQFNSNCGVYVCLCVSRTELDGWVQPKPTETGFTGQQLRPSFPR